MNVFSSKNILILSLLFSAQINANEVSIGVRANKLVLGGGMHSPTFNFITDEIAIEGTLKSVGQELFLQASRGFVVNIEISANSCVVASGGQSDDILTIRDSSLGKTVCRVGNTKLEFKNTKFASLEISQLKGETSGRVMLGQGVTVAGNVVLKNPNITLEVDATAKIAGQIVREEETQPEETPKENNPKAEASVAKPEAIVEDKPLKTTTGAELRKPRDPKEVEKLSVKVLTNPTNTNSCLYLSLGNNELVSLKDYLEYCQNKLRFNFNTGKFGIPQVNIPIEILFIDWESAPTWTLVKNNDDGVSLRLHEKDSDGGFFQSPILQINNVTGSIALVAALFQYELAKIHKPFKDQFSPILLFSNKCDSKAWGPLIKCNSDDRQLLTWKTYFAKNPIVDFVVYFPPQSNFGLIVQSLSLSSKFNKSYSYLSDFTEWPPLEDSSVVFSERKLNQNYPIEFVLAHVGENGELHFYGIPDSSKVKFAYFPKDDSKIKILTPEECVKKYPEFAVK